MQAWQIVVPVKSTRRGKSRIEVPVDVRQRLAAAMAADTVTAIAAVARVIVVAEDAQDARQLTRSGVEVLLTAVSGLNAAIALGVAAARPGPVGVLPADLPGLVPTDLAVALAAGRDFRRGVVADRQGVGTTLLTASAGSDLVAAYGPGSFRRHVAAGYRALDVAVDSSVRRDVDVLADLAGHAVGSATRRVLDDLGQERPPAVSCAAR